MLKCLFSRPEDEDGADKNLCVDEDTIEKFRVFAEGYHKRLYTHRRTAVTKKPQEKSILANYIRQFEPIVVNALRVS